MPDLPPYFHTFFTKEKNPLNGKEGTREKPVITGITHQFWLDFFLLLSSLCPSWLGVLLLCYSLKKSCLKTARAEESGSKGVWFVQLGCVCVRERVQRSESRLWLMHLFTRQTQLICSQCAKKATPSYCSTQTASKTLLDWVCLCCSFTHSSSLRHVSLLLYRPASRSENCAQSFWHFQLLCCHWVLKVISICRKKTMQWDTSIKTKQL